MRQRNEFLVRFGFQVFMTDRAVSSAHCIVLSLSPKHMQQAAVEVMKAMFGES
jgi:hypothetical protein